MLDRIETRPPTLRIMALERLREAIVQGRISPGDRLVERDLGERLGVSRSVIREVIRNLESEGLVENALSGPRLATITVEQAKQIYEVRIQLESSAAAACAAVCTKKIAASLTAALAALAQAHERDDSIGALHATTRFYEIIFLTGRHEVAWEIVQRLNGRISQMRAMTLATSGRQVAGLRRLKRIADAIGGKDAAEAALACREHLQEAASIAIAILQGRPAEG